MIRRLVQKLNSQECDRMTLPGDMINHAETTGLDWILIESLKWATACEKIQLPDDLSFGRLATLFSQ